MKLKIIWLIGGLFFIVLVWQIIIATDIISKAKTTYFKNVAGDTDNLPQPVKEALVRPPKKSSDALDPQIAAKSAILIDVSSAYIMYAENPNEKVPIASTTKIMTAIVVLENYSDKLNDVVTITYPMVNIEGSDIKLQVGEKITVENLLKGLLIMSGNDTAFALATHFGAAQSGSFRQSLPTASAPAGGKDAFVTVMNQKARDLGLQNTNFKDPAGLDDEGYSSAHDLAILASYAMRHDKFREIVKTPETTITSVDGGIVHDLKSSNRMIRAEEFYYFPYALGIKTGFTNEAGHCLVFAAGKDGHEILGVVLNTNENSITASARESKKLLEWGFANWTWQ